MPVDKSERRIRKMFGEISPRYDFLNHFLSGGTDYYWRWRTVRRPRRSARNPCSTSARGPATWQSLTGGGAAAACASSGPTSPMRCCVWPGRKRRRLVPPRRRIDFVEADAQRLPFADDQFQIVSVAFGLRNVTNTLAGLSEMARVCVRGDASSFWNSPCRAAGSLAAFIAGTFGTCFRASADSSRGTRARTRARWGGGLSILAGIGLGISLRGAPRGYDEVVRTRSRHLDESDVRDRDALYRDKKRREAKFAGGLKTGHECEQRQTWSSA